MSKTARRRLTPKQIKEIRLRVVAGQPIKHVVADLRVSKSIVYLITADLPRRSQMGRLRKLSEDQRNQVALRLLGGERAGVLAAEFGVRLEIVTNVRRTLRSMNALTRIRKRSPLRLSFIEREEISRGIERAESARSIGRALGRAGSTITREIKRGGGRDVYRACLGEDLFLSKSLRPRPAKLKSNSELQRHVELGLANFWSPEQVSRQLRSDYPHDPSMRVSHETIYQSLFVQGRGALREELTRYLRTRRKVRRPKGLAKDQRGHLKDMVSIRDRPAEAEDRAVPGHWEGDLIIGRGGKSAVATLVERRSRFVMLVALPDGRTAEAVRQALAKKILTLPEELRKTLTWDQGSEMAQHVAFTVDTGVKVYFCDPHSPWQRGSNENTNGLLRQFLPKTADLNKVPQRELDHIADLMNGRPRETLNWAKPCDYLRRAVAMTA